MSKKKYTAVEILGALQARAVDKETQTETGFAREPIGAIQGGRVGHRINVTVVRTDRPAGGSYGKGLGGG